jgi:hypothetical protein
VDEVAIGRKKVSLKSDGRVPSERVNTRHDTGSLRSYCTEKVKCHFVSECAAVKTAKVLLCSLGNTRPGQKVSGLSSEGAVRRQSLHKTVL